MAITKLVTDRQVHIDDAKALLMEAIDEGFEAVVIVGIKQDHKVSCKSSKSLDTLKLLGSVEWAKEVILKQWK